jgi:hypothetical protein
MFIICDAKVFAVSTSFYTEPISAERKEKVLSNISFSPMEFEPRKKGFECFDINEHGMIVLVSSTFKGESICVYDSDGVFQYGFTFDDAGSVGALWDGDIVNIYYVRGDLLVSVNSCGEVLDVVEAPSTVENNAYYREIIKASKRTVGSTTYIARGHSGSATMFTSSYTKLTAKDSDGNETVIYDATAYNTAKVILVSVVAALFVILVGLYIIRSYKKGNQTRPRTGNNSPS